MLIRLGKTSFSINRRKKILFRNQSPNLSLKLIIHSRTKRTSRKLKTLLLKRRYPGLSWMGINQTKTMESKLISKCCREMLTCPFLVMLTPARVPYRPVCFCSMVRSSNMTSIKCQNWRSFMASQLLSSLTWWIKTKKRGDAVLQSMWLKAFSKHSSKT